MAQDIDFAPKAFGTPNPDWTKKRVRTHAALERLADHICTRTPPLSYKNDRLRLYETIVRRNQDAIGFWDNGYEALTDQVSKRLIARDGSL